MGFAYDGTPPIYTTARGDTVAHLIADLDTIVLSATWGTKTAITGGFKYTLISPQGLTCKVRIYLFDATTVAIQFTNSSETLLGHIHGLTTGGGKVYTVHCGVCQIFISLPGISGTVSTSFQGGILAIPDDTVDCHVSAGPNFTTEAWWSNGSSNLFDQTDFRNSLWSNNSWSACRDGVLVGSDVGHVISQAESRLRLATVCLSTNVDFHFSKVERTAYYNGESLKVEPIVLWADNDGGIAKAIGVLWNAFINTIELFLDAEFTVVDHTTGLIYPFVGYSQDLSGVGNTRYGSVALLKGVAVTNETSAYWYVR